MLSSVVIWIILGIFISLTRIACGLLNTLS